MNRSKSSRKHRIRFAVDGAFRNRKLGDTTLPYLGGKEIFAVAVAKGNSTEANRVHIILDSHVVCSLLPSLGRVPVLTCNKTADELLDLWGQVIQEATLTDTTPKRKGRTVDHVQETTLRIKTDKDTITFVWKSSAVQTFLCPNDGIELLKSFQGFVTHCRDLVHRARTAPPSLPTTNVRFIFPLS